jgi:predicted aspartyl protease
VYRWIDERGVPHYGQGIDSIPERFRSRAAPLDLRDSPSTPAAASVPARLSAGGGTSVRFTPGDRIVVEARINGGTPARLLLDTGADRTVIAPRALAAAGVSLTRGVAAQIVGVTGSADVRGVGIGSLEVGGARVGPLVVVAHDVSQPDVDGLLGRDFLGHFSVNIDSAAGIVTLAPK